MQVERVTEKVSVRVGFSDVLGVPPFSTASQVGWVEESCHVQEQGPSIEDHPRFNIYKHVKSFKDRVVLLLLRSI